MPNKYIVIMHLHILLLSCKNNLLDVVKSIQNNVGIEEQISSYIKFYNAIKK